MDKVHVNRLEKFKDILLVVLVFTTILLLYFLWGSKSLESFIFSDDNEHYTVLSSEQVIFPDQIILGKGNGDYIIVTSEKENLWKGQILENFRNMSQDANILVEEITEEKYKAAMAYPSIIAKFAYNMPFNEFCDKYQIKQQQGYDSISDLTEIGFSKGSKESAFIFDGNKKRYYRLVGNKELNIFDQVESLFTQQNLTTYFPLKTFLGEKSNNDTLVPVENSSAMASLAYQKDSQISQKEITEDTAQDYFGGTFDFVRKIEESNGTIIYMYGYGQKVLIINPNEGSIEYKEEIKINDSEQKNMFECLDTALAFVGAHGDFQTAAGQEIKPYLESASSIDDKKNAYRFVFSFSVGKNKLFYEDKMPIIIEVTGGQVSYFRRELVNFDESQLQKKSGEQGISAINMLAMNYNYILAKTNLLDKLDSQEISFEDTADRIDDLFTGYFRPSVKLSGDENTSGDNQLELIPVWVVEVNGMYLYFDLYDGQPKGYSKAY
ncbi:MAG: hypothetical protein E7222_06645 [Clostridiales bacterium]|nr:hypothetical protein [Clostridiales bacterium]